MLVNSQTESKSIVVAACIRNARHEIPLVFKNINRLVSYFKEARCILIESNSTDNTLDVIKENKHILGCKLTCIGLKNINFPSRMENISYARNYYLDIIKKQYNTFDYVYMLDFNETNVEPYDMSGVLSCFNTTEDWDMICANQEQLYYDLYALRHDIWMPSNCWAAVGNRPSFIDELTAKKMFIYSKFIHIKKNHSLIKVRSAFGGSAFIKTTSLLQSKFSPYDKNNNIDCEWVSFCKSMNNVYINPRFINMRKLSRHIPHA